MLVRVVALAALLGCRDVPDRRLGPDAAADATPQPDADYGEDGAPVRRPCFQDTNGTVMASGQFGRLDGILVAVVPLDYRGCHGDDDHIHLQILAGGAYYDIAVNVGPDVHSTTFDRALLAPAWSEGWHTGVSVDYLDFAISSDTIPRPGTTALAKAMTDDLATANHISVYATGYGPEGAHLVHRNGGGRDGLIVTHPLAAAAHARAFSFDSQTY